MSINPNEDTEFNDALRKHGIIPPREQAPPSPSPPASPTFEDILDDFDDPELNELADDAKDDETERMIHAFRQQRMEEERKQDRRARFGRVYPIGRDDYTREVTEASNIDEEDDEEELGTGVVCFLYKDGIPRSDRTFEHIRSLATRYPRTKFVSIVGDKCIPNLPDTRVPMLIMYKKGQIRQQITAWAADRERKVEELEALLLVADIIHPPDRPPPKSSRTGGNESSEDEEENDRDKSSRMKSSAAFTNGRAGKNIRGPAKKSGGDSDSDFEFDM